MTERFTQRITENIIQISLGWAIENISNTAEEDEVLFPALQKLADLEDLKDQGRLIELPCSIGDKLYRVTYPYRKPAKVTTFTVKNFRTVGKQHRIQLEVQADNVPAKNWMYFEGFYTTKEEAEAVLKAVLSNA